MSTGNNFTPKTSGALTEEVLKLGKLFAADHANVVCLIFGLGGGTKRLYSEATTRGRVRLIWTYSVVPGWLFWLRPFTAETAGLVEVEEPSALPSCFELVAQCASICVLVVNKSEAENIAEILRTRRGWTGIDEICYANRYRGLLCAVLDVSSDTGIVSWLSIQSDSQN